MHVLLNFQEGKIQKIDVRVVKIDVQEKIVRQYLHKNSDNLYWYYAKKSEV